MTAPVEMIETRGAARGEGFWFVPRVPAAAAPRDSDFLLPDDRVDMTVEAPVSITKGGMQWPIT